jgi:hypothetical protein
MLSFRNILVACLVLLCNKQNVASMLHQHQEHLKNSAERNKHHDTKHKTHQQNQPLLRWWGVTRKREKKLKIISKTFILQTKLSLLSKNLGGEELSV